MIHESLSAAQFAPMLAGSGAVLKTYARPQKEFLGEQGGRWGVLILPGGGYHVIAESEGEPVALAFLGAGVQAFVLEYSIAPDARWPQALRETAAAVAYLRQNAERYGIDPHKIAVCGFSAGGHLAGCAANLWGHEALNGLGLSPEAVRPDASILCYPVISDDPKFGHVGSFTQLLGEGVETPRELWLENSVTAQTPPTFLWATVTDDTVPVENTMTYAAALRREGVPFELHLYGDGPHAMGLATADSAWNPDFTNPHAASWHGLCVEWLRRLP
jgi:acetyl esterase/lipase